MGNTQDSGTLSKAAGKLQSEVLVVLGLIGGGTRVVRRVVGASVEDGTHDTRAGHDGAVITPARIDTDNDRDLLRRGKSVLKRHGQFAVIAARRGHVRVSQSQRGRFALHERWRGWEEKRS